MRRPISARLPVEHLGAAGATAFWRGDEFVHIKVSFADDAHIEVR